MCKLLTLTDLSKGTLTEKRIKEYLKLLYACQIKTTSKLHCEKLNSMWLSFHLALLKTSSC